MRMKGKGNEREGESVDRSREYLSRTVDLEVKATGTQSGQGWGTQVEWLRSLGSDWQRVAWRRGADNGSVDSNGSHYVCTYTHKSLNPVVVTSPVAL